MGALHIEDKIHNMIGKLLRDSGWTAVLSQAQVLTSGRAQSTLNENHIKRTRYAHHVSLMSLNLLKKTAYCRYCENTIGLPEPFDVWNKRMQSFPQFNFWSTIIDLELLMTRFLRSLREGDFKLYVQVCDELCNWFHALDHTNYARWLPVYVRDMVMLSDTHPEVYDEFMKGNFVVQKSAKKFSLIAKDQAHEQSNKSLQAHGGASGLYECPEALTLFMLAGPDCARIVEEFEATFNQPSSNSTAHHEENHSMQIKFCKDVKSFTNVVEQLDNPFLSMSDELVTLDTQTVMDPSVATSLSCIHKNGQALHSAFCKERLEQANVPLSQTIKRNNMLTFANRPDTKSKSMKNSGTQKHNTTLVTQLFLSLQSRPDADIMDFFRYENQKEPPSLADRGMMRSGAKSDILSCVNAPTCRSSAIKEATVMIFDMAAVINMIRPTLAKNFREYVSLHIIPYFKSKMSDNTQRLDAVWDTYPDDNLKALTQQKRGNGARIKVGDDSTPIPRHEWNTSFLKNEDNKKELFAFISKQLSTTELNGRLLLTTHLETVLSNKDIDLSSLEPCNHAEADTRIMLHLAHAAEQGHTIAYVRTVDSDVVVLTIHYFHTFGLSELWVGFGCGKYYRDIPVHAICSSLGPTKSQALPLFHSLTGCDTTSQFLGCGKKTAWAAWASLPNLTDTLIELTQYPHRFTLESGYMTIIERFIVIMYSKGCGAKSVNEARHHLFTTGQKTLDNIPPTLKHLYTSM